MRTRTGVGAALLSLAQPGVGQMMAGRHRSAAALWIAAVALGFALLGGLLGGTFASLAVGLGALVLLALGSAVDAYRRVRARQSVPRWFERWYVCLPAMLLLQVGARALLVPTPKVQSFVVPAGSMEPTLEIGDRFMLDRQASAMAPVRRGDVVCFESPERPGVLLVKRAVAVAGDSVAIVGKQLIVNGRPEVEPWVSHRDSRVFPSVGFLPKHAARRDQMDELEVPAGMLFVLGDNRDASYDSRFFGCVPETAVIGRPLYVYWSKSLDRIGRSLQPAR